MRTSYHEFESLEHLLATRLLPGGDHHPIRFVVFGGTGAVGGAAVMELCRMILMSQSLSKAGMSGQIHATGLGDKEVSKFVHRMYMALEDEVAIEKIEPRRHYRLGGRIDLHFDLFRLQIPENLGEYVTDALAKGGPDSQIESVLTSYFEAQDCPFQNFVESLGYDMLHAVLVAIPLPSVATYTLTSIDQLARQHEMEHQAINQVKKSYLQTFIGGLAVILQRYARHVVMAHTTAVGGMYRVDGGKRAEIRLGFAHSALGDKLVDKKYFADRLTRLFIDQGFDVLVTAAAIGIDAVEFRCHLPADRAVRQVLQGGIESAESPALPAADLAIPRILLYPSQAVPLAELPETPEPLYFGAGKDLMVDAAIRSGENGLFSVANCVALYNVMKVAIPEELAMVLVRRAIFGPERRRDWFVDKICHYTETENSYFALRLLDNNPQLAQAHFGAFSIQAYQALGSSTHQARLHELGLLLLCLRLRQLRGSFLDTSEDELAAGILDMDEFFRLRTRMPGFEDLDDLEVSELASTLTALCQVESMEDAGLLLGYDARSQGIRQPVRERFLHRLATRIGRYRQTINSLGIPIIFRAGDQDQALVGPYLAPLDMAVTRTNSLAGAWSHEAEKYGTTEALIRDGVVANNGFIDLRPHAIGNAAKNAGPHLAQQVRRMNTEQELLDWMGELAPGSYFTTCGLVALLVRLRRLGTKVRRRKILLGTRETWKHIFPQDAEGNHLMSPGLVETVRMYTEGQGKVTGTEALWPRWGY